MSAFGGKGDIPSTMVKTPNQGDNHDAMSVQDTTASGGISGR